MRKAFITAIVAIAMICMIVACKADCAYDRSSLSVQIDSMLFAEFPGDAPGAVVLIAKGDSTIYCRTVGMARLDTIQEITPRTMFNVASSTKTFTAAAILKLAEQHRLSLDDAITKYHPNLSDSVFGGITLRHILANTSGIPDGRPVTNEQWNTYLTESKSVFANASDFRIFGSERELTRFIERVDSLRFRPGSDFDPQGPPYMLLMDVIEKASGQDFESWMAENIFAPAGVSDFAYVSAEPISGNMAHAYRRTDCGSIDEMTRSSDGRWAEYDYGEVDYFLTRVDQGLYISACDFVKTIQALHTLKILSAEMLAYYHTPVVTPECAGKGYGMGINISIDGLGREKLYHRASRGGFVSVEAYYPQYDVTYVVFSNRNDWDYNTFADRVESVIANNGLLSDNWN